MRLNGKKKIHKLQNARKYKNVKINYTQNHINSLNIKRGIFTGNIPSVCAQNIQFAASIHTHSGTGACAL